MTVLRIALAQLNPTVGDLDGNLAKLLDAYARADSAGCDIVAFPELSITTSPCALISARWVVRAKSSS